MSYNKVQRHMGHHPVLNAEVGRSWRLKFPMVSQKVHHITAFLMHTVHTNPTHTDL